MFPVWTEALILDIQKQLQGLIHDLLLALAAAAPTMQGKSKASHPCH